MDSWNFFQRSALRSIHGIDRNDLAHARFMGSDPTREPPLLFQKPTDAMPYRAAVTVAEYPYPTLTKNYHGEAELVEARGKGGRNIRLGEALEYGYGYTLGWAMKRREYRLAKSCPPTIAVAPTNFRVRPSPAVSDTYQCFPYPLADHETHTAL